MNLIQRTLELRPLAPIRLWLWHRQAAKTSMSVSHIAAKEGYAELDIRKRTLGMNKASSTLFILGSGSSINELSISQFSIIQSHISIGINAWAIHNFVPDLYCFETGKAGGAPADDTLYISERLQRKEVVDARPEFLFLRPTLPATVKNLVRAPSTLDGKGTLYGRTNLISRSQKNLVTDLERVLQRIWSGHSPSNVLFDNGSSVVRMIVLGFAQGFRDIVLAGVDLDSRPYFWLAPNSPYRSADTERIFSRPANTPHSTLSTDGRPFATNEVITTLASILSRRYGVRLWVAKSSSTLSVFLPTFPWRER